MAKRRRRSVKSWKNKSKKLFRTLKQWGMGGMVLALVVSAYLGLTETEPGRMLADQALHLLGGQGSQGTILAQGEAEGAAGAIHFIDVGQGDAVLIQQDGEFCLIDAGTSQAGDDLLDYLDRAGAGHLKLLVLTHPHADHIGSAQDVLEHCQVDQVLLPDESKSEKQVSYTMAKVKQTMESLGVPGVVGEVGQTYSIGSGTLTVVGDGIRDDNMNNISLVTRFDAPDLSFLDSGDGEEEEEEALLEEGANLRADLFKAAHHGSSGANSAEFLAAVRPALVTASCGLDNDYGHPHQEAVERFEAAGAQFHRTDLEGDVVVWATPEGYLVQTEKGSEDSLRPAA